MTRPSPVTPWRRDFDSRPSVWFRRIFGLIFLAAATSGAVWIVIRLLPVRVSTTARYGLNPPHVKTLLPRLQYSANDRTAFAKALGQYDHSTNSSPLDAGTVTDLINHVSSSSDEGVDVLLLSLRGHGATLPRVNSPNNPAADPFWIESESKEIWNPASQTPLSLKGFEKANAEHVVVFVDGLHVNCDNWMGMLWNGFGHCLAEQALKQSESPNGAKVWIIAPTGVACPPSHADRRSAFSLIVTEGLQRAKDLNDDGRITFDEFCAFLSGATIHCSSAGFHVPQIAVYPPLQDAQTKERAEQFVLRWLQPAKKEDPAPSDEPQKAAASPADLRFSKIGELHEAIAAVENGGALPPPSQGAQASRPNSSEAPRALVPSGQSPRLSQIDPRAWRLMLKYVADYEAFVRNGEAFPSDLQDSLRVARDLLTDRLRPAKSGASFATDLSASLFAPETPDVDDPSRISLASLAALSVENRERHEDLQQILATLYLFASKSRPELEASEIETLKGGAASGKESQPTEKSEAAAEQKKVTLSEWLKENDDRLKPLEHSPEITLIKLIEKKISGDWKSRDKNETAPAAEKQVGSDLRDIWKRVRDLAKVRLDLELLFVRGPLADARIESDLDEANRTLVEIERKLADSKEIPSPDFIDAVRSLQDECRRLSTRVEAVESAREALALAMARAPSYVAWHGNASARRGPSPRDIETLLDEMARTEQSLQSLDSKSDVAFSGLLSAITTLDGVAAKHSQDTWTDTIVHIGKRDANTAILKWLGNLDLSNPPSTTKPVPETYDGQWFKDHVKLEWRLIDSYAAKDSLSKSLQLHKQRIQECVTTVQKSGTLQWNSPEVLNVSIALRDFYHRLPDEAMALLKSAADQAKPSKEDARDLLARLRSIEKLLWLVDPRDFSDDRHRLTQDSPCATRQRLRRLFHNMLGAQIKRHLPDKQELTPQEFDHRVRTVIAYQTCLRANGGSVADAPSLSMNTSDCDVKIDGSEITFTTQSGDWETLKGWKYSLQYDPAQLTVKSNKNGDVVPPEEKRDIPQQPLLIQQQDAATQGTAEIIAFLYQPVEMASIKHVRKLIAQLDVDLVDVDVQGPTTGRLSASGNGWQWEVFPGAESVLAMSLVNRSEKPLTLLEVTLRAGDIVAAKEIIDKEADLAGRKSRPLKWTMEAKPEAIHEKMSLHLVTRYVQEGIERTSRRSLDVRVLESSEYLTPSVQAGTESISWKVAPRDSNLQFPGELKVVAHIGQKESVNPIVLRDGKSAAVSAPLKREAFQELMLDLRDGNATSAFRYVIGGATISNDVMPVDVGWLRAEIYRKVDPQADGSIPTFPSALVDGVYHVPGNDAELRLTAVGGLKQHEQILLTLLQKGEVLTDPASLPRCSVDYSYATVEGDLAVTAKVIPTEYALEKRGSGTEPETVSIQIGEGRSEFAIFYDQRPPTIHVHESTEPFTIEQPLTLDVSVDDDWPRIEKVAYVVKSADKEIADIEKEIETEGRTQTLQQNRASLHLGSFDKPETFKVWVLVKDPCGQVGQRAVSFKVRDQPPPRRFTPVRVRVVHAKSKALQTEAKVACGDVKAQEDEKSPGTYLFDELEIGTSYTFKAVKNSPYPMIGEIKTTIVADQPEITLEIGRPEAK